jgi:hypothetical protein
MSAARALGGNSFSRRKSRVAVIETRANVRLGSAGADSAALSKAKAIGISIARTKKLL